MLRSDRGWVKSMPAARAGCVEVMGRLRRSGEQLLGVIAHHESDVLLRAALEEVGEPNGLGHPLGVRVVGPEQHLAGADPVHQRLDVVFGIWRHVAELAESGARTA